MEFSQKQKKTDIAAYREMTIRGYRVKVSYRPVSEEERKIRRETIARILAQSVLREMREKEQKKAQETSPSHEGR